VRSEKGNGLKAMLGLLGEQGSDFAHKVDFANDVVTIISVICTVAIVGTMLYFAMIYRQRDGKDHETPAIEGNNTLEVIWTVFPTLVCIWVAWLGYDSFVDLRSPPPDAMEINVTGRKWAWDFQYKNGKRTTSELVVPVDQPVKLIMTSKAFLLRAGDAHQDGCYSWSLHPRVVPSDKDRRLSGVLHRVLWKRALEDDGAS